MFPRRVLVALVLSGCAQELPLPAAPTPPPPPGEGSLTGRIVRAVPGQSAVEPVADALVRLLRTNVVARTNAEGRFVLAPVPADDGTILVQAGAREDGSFVLQRFLSVAALGARPGRDVSAGDLLVGENATIRGRARLADLGDAPRGHRSITVFVPEGPFTTYTGDDGSYVLENVPAGNVSLAFFRDGYAPATRGAVELRAGEALALRDVLLDRSAEAPGDREVRGALSTRPAVESLAAATVAIRLGDEQRSVAVAADGSWSTRLGPGLYSFTFALEGYAAVSLHNVFVPGATGADAAFVLPGIVLTPAQDEAPLPPPPPRPDEPGPGVLTGRVVRPAGDGSGLAPAAGARVRLLQSNLVATTAADGTFTLAPLTADDGTLFVQHGLEADGTWASQRLVDLAPFGVGPGLTVDAGDLVVRGNATATGRVLLADRVPSQLGHRGITVLVPGTTVSGFSSDDGSFQLPNVPEGVVDFVFFRDGYDGASLTGVDVRGGESLRFRDVVLDPATSTEPRAVTGRVQFDPPVADPALGSVTATGGETIEAWTPGADGTFAGTLPPGRYRLDYAYPGYGTLVIHNVLVGAGATPLPLAPVTLSTEQAPVDDPPPEQPPVIPPTAAIVAPAFAEVSRTIVLDGGASWAPAGHVLTWAWRQVGGDVLTFVDEDGPGQVRPRVTVPPAPQEIAIQLTVTDTRTGLTAVAEAAIEAVEAPVASIAAPPRARAGGLVTLDASASTGPAGHDLRFTWTQLAGATVDLLRNGSTDAAVTSFTGPPVPQTLRFQLEVEDLATTLRATATTEVVLDVPPTALATAPALVATGETVTLDASATIAPSGHPLSFTWVQGAGDSVVLSENGSPAAATTTFSAPLRAQALAFDLTVLDLTTDLAATTRVRLTVAEPPTAQIAPAAVVRTGATGRLDASGSSGAAGAVLSYAWEQLLGDPVTLSADDGVLAATPSFVAPETPQALQFRVTVTDLQTGLASTATRVVVVADPPVAVAAPTALETRPATPFAVDGAGSFDPHGATLTYRWSSPDGHLTFRDGSETTSRVVAVSPEIEGNFALKLVVSSGAVDSDPVLVSVRVLNATPLAPTVGAGADRAVSPGQRVVLQATGHHPDPTVALAFQWAQSDGVPSVALNDANTATAWFDAPGTSAFLRFRVSLTADGQTVSDEIEIQVQDTTRPTVIATEPAAGLLGSPFFATVTFDEPILESSISATTVFLSDASNARIEASRTYLPDLKQIRIVPVSPLTAGATITLSVDGVQDRAPLPNTLSPAFTATYQVRPPQWRLWSSPVETGGAPKPDLTVVGGDAVVSATRNSGTCTGTGTGGSWILRPGPGADLVPDADCVPGKVGSALQDNALRIGGTRFLALPQAAGTPVVLKETPGGWYRLPNPAPGTWLFEFGPELYGAWHKYPTTDTRYAGPTLSRLDPVSGAWVESGTLPLGRDPSTNQIFLDGVHDGTHAGFAVARLRWEDAWSPWDMDALFFEHDAGVWQQVGPPAYYINSGAGSDSLGVRGAYFRGAPIVYYRRYGARYAPPIVQVGIWRRDAATWFLHPASITTRGSSTDLDAEENYFLYETGGRVYLRQLSWDGTTGSFADVPGPDAAYLNTSATCTASHARLTVDAGAVWVTFDETCSPGEWHVRVRRLN